MPTVKITASQVVYYEKTVDLEQDEYDTLIGMYENQPTADVIQWLADGCAGFRSTDEVEQDAFENLDITRA